MPSCGSPSCGHCHPVHARRPRRARRAPRAPRTTIAYDGGAQRTRARLMLQLARHEPDHVVTLEPSGVWPSWEVLRLGHLGEHRALVRINSGSVLLRPTLDDAPGAIQFHALGKRTRGKRAVRAIHREVCLAKELHAQKMADEQRWLERAKENNKRAEAARAAAFKEAQEIDAAYHAVVADLRLQGVAELIPSVWRSTRRTLRLEVTDPTRARAILEHLIAAGLLKPLS